MRCVACNKTGKVPDLHDPEKLIPCLNCDGKGWFTTRGKTKAD